MKMSGTKRSLELTSMEDEIRQLISGIIHDRKPYLVCKDFYHYMTGTLCCMDRYSCNCKPDFDEKFSKKYLIARRVLVETVTDSPNRCLSDTVAYKPNLELMVFILDGCGWIFEKFIMDISGKNVFKIFLVAKVVNMGDEFLEQVAKKCLQTNCTSFFESLISISYNLGEERTKRYIVESISWRNNIWIFLVNNLFSMEVENFTEEFLSHVSENNAAREILRNVINYKTFRERVNECNKRIGSPEPTRLGSEQSESESYVKH